MQKKHAITLILFVTFALIPFSSIINCTDSFASSDTETIFWQSIKDSQNPKYFEAYLKKYPGGAFAPIAEIKLEELRGELPATTDLASTSETKKDKNTRSLPKISLEQAKSTGIPSPPHNIVIGKKWVAKLTDLTSKRITYFEREITDETDHIYNIKFQMFDAQKKLIDSFTETVNKNGTHFIEKGNKLYKTETSGYLWPPTRVKTGDTWTSVVKISSDSSLYNTTTKFTVMGFEHYGGYDCIVLVKVKTVAGNTPDLGSYSKDYFAYNEGVTVYSQGVAKDKISGESLNTYELLSLEYL